MPTLDALMRLAAVSAAMTTPPPPARPAHAQRGGAKGDFSQDGCRTQADVTYRREMLANIQRGVQSGAVLLREHVWYA